MQRRCIRSADPDLLKGVDPEKITLANKSEREVMEVLCRYTLASKVSQLVISVPSPAWAKKVFPHLSEKEQVEKLWEAIFEAVRVNSDDPIASWKKHGENLHNKAKF